MSIFRYVGVVVLTKSWPDRLVLHTVPCCTCPQGIRSSNNSDDMPAANCHPTGCPLSLNGCLWSCPFAAALAQSQEKHARVLDVSDSIFCREWQTGWRSSTCGSASVLHFWLGHQAPCFLSWKTTERAGMNKCVFSFLLCSESVLRLSGLAGLRPLLLWLWLRWLRTSTSLCVPAVYALLLRISEILKNVCVLCKGASRGEFLFHSLSSQVFLMASSHQASLQLLWRKISEAAGTNLEQRLY